MKKIFQSPSPINAMKLSSNLLQKNKSVIVLKGAAVNYIAFDSLTLS